MNPFGWLRQIAILLFAPFYLVGWIACVAWVWVRMGWDAEMENVP